MRAQIKITAICLFVTGTLYLSSCSEHKSLANYSTFETECMGLEMDGSQTLQAWGTGKNKADAQEQAKKTAVNDVLFKGIRKGKQGCEVIPVVPEVNARKKYEDYFNKFFTDGGEYKNFVTMQDNAKNDKMFKDKKATGSEVQYGVVVRILRVQLKEKMINDKILNP